MIKICLKDTFKSIKMNDKRPNTIPGYVHPDNTIKHRGTMYKTFTEGQKPKKKEKFGSTVAGSQYASYDTSQETRKTQYEIEKERQTFEAMHANQDRK